MMDKETELEIKRILPKSKEYIERIEASRKSHNTRALIKEYSEWGYSLLRLADTLRDEGKQDAKQAYCFSVELFEQSISEFKQECSEKSLTDEALARELKERDGFLTCGISNNCGLAYCNLGNYPKAISKYKSAIIINPLGIYYNNCGVAYAYEEHFDQAKEYYQEAIRRNKKYIDAHLNFGDAFYKTADYEQALIQYKQVCSLCEEAVSKLQSKNYLKIMEVYNITGAHNLETPQEVMRAIKIKNIKALKHSGITNIRNFNFQQALDNFEEAYFLIEKQRLDVPDRIDISFNKAYIFWRQGKYELARWVWNEASYLCGKMLLGKQHPNHYLLLGRVQHSIFRNYNNAMSSFKRGLDKKSGALIDVDLYLAQIKLLLDEANENRNKRMNNSWEVRSLYHTAEKILLNYLKEHQIDGSEDQEKNLSDYSQIDNRTSQIHIFCQQTNGYSLSPREILNSRLKLSNLYILTEEYEKAKCILVDCLGGGTENEIPLSTDERVKNTFFIEIYCRLAYISSMEMDVEKGVFYLKKALISDPFNLDIRTNLARLYLKKSENQHDLENLRKAEIEYKSVFEMSWHYIDAHLGLAEVYTNMGELGNEKMYEIALGYLCSALDLYFNGKGSKNLSKIQLSQIFYSKAYVKMKIYQFSKDVKILTTIKNDLEACLRNNSENYLAVWALNRLRKRKESLANSLIEYIGPWMVVIPSLLILVVSIISFLGILPFHEKALGSQMNKSDFATLFFGSLTFLIIGLSLPQILKLKVVGIELEKQSLDQSQIQNLDIEVERNVFEQQIEILEVGMLDI